MRHIVNMRDSVSFCKQILIEYVLPFGYFFGVLNFSLSFDLSCSLGWREETPFLPSEIWRLPQLRRLLIPHWLGAESVTEGNESNVARPPADVLESSSKISLESFLVGCCTPGLGTRAYIVGGALRTLCSADISAGTDIVWLMEVPGVIVGVDGDDTAIATLDGDIDCFDISGVSKPRRFPSDGTLSRKGIGGSGG
jgi:hypothetical protein